jgi:hypothetical protein
MEVKGRSVDGWTQFETPSALEYGVTIISGQIFFCNHRAEVFISALDAEDPNTLKVTQKHRAGTYTFCGKNRSKLY